MCTEDTLRPAPCDPRRLYLHLLCGHGWGVKAKRWNMLNLWFIDDTDYMRPMFADGGGPKGPHPFMPCDEKVAWWDLEVQNPGD